MAGFGDDTLRAEVLQPRPWEVRLEMSAPVPVIWLPVCPTCPSNPPESALPWWGHLTFRVLRPLLTVALLDLVTIFGPGFLQNA